ncbi:A-kinase anchor protein 12 isoform X2 [Lissotriton helveticus]
MGAGSSAAQTAGAGEEGSEAAATAGAEVADPGTPPELLVLLEDEDHGAGDTKILRKNGQISAINGTAEDQVKLSFQAEDTNGEEAEAGTDVGQREAAAVSQKEEPTESLETMPQEEPAVLGIEQKDSQEAIEEVPVTEEKIEQVEQTSDAQSNEVGFKKVFKFVGFKFTVKKDKTEKTEPVQLLTVKKEDIDANGTDTQEAKKSENAELKPETVEQSKPESLEIENHNGNINSVEETVTETLTGKDSVDSAPEKTEESDGQVESRGAVEEEKEPKMSPESPVNPLVQETSSPFRKFFTQSWAGLRKRTSFKKPKEDEQQVVEKNATEQEMDKAEIPGEASDKLKPGEDQEPVTEETAEPASGISTDQKPEILLVEHAEAISAPVADISKDVKSEESTVSIVEKVEKSLEEKPPGERQVPLADIAEVYVEDNLEHESITPTSEETKEEEGIADVVVTGSVKDGMAEVTVLTVASSSEQPGDVPVQAVKPTDEPTDSKEALEAAGDVLECKVEPSPPDASAQSPEGITNEAELLSSQEKAKLQGSPLRKLFAGSSLKKLSGKKHKPKKEAEAKPEEREPKPEGTAEQLQSSSESPEAPEAEKEDSIPSSPEEPVDTASVEKPTTDAMQTSEGEGEGATSDGERKKDGITPWASFKKLVTPKKRVKKLSESDKEDEPEKAAKSATMSSTDSANSENQEESKAQESKAQEEEPKLEKSTEEPKRKVDSSVSWEALICVGSSKKRGRKTSDSDEEETPKPLEENQKTEEQDAIVKSAETETEAPLASSQESDQGQESPSPEQAGSPSEGEGVSTWTSFKRLVTPRRKSKTRMEEKAEESATVLNTEHPTSEGEPGKEESWVSFKKLIPGRKKKKSDGKQEHALVEEGQETVEDEDDVPAVVPLSEYEAAEQEKLEAQQVMETETVRKDIVPLASCAEDDLEQAQEPSEGLVHAVTVTVVEGERAVTTMEERSPSWISATVTESIQKEDASQEVQQTEQVFETDVVVEQAVVVKSLEFVHSEATDHTTANEMELTSEAVTALEEAIEVSCAEETTEMVSAVSQLGESCGTSEESTPVAEVENGELNLEELKKQTQEVLEEVAEKVRLSEAAKAITTTTVIEVTFSSSKANEVEKDMGEVIVAKQELLLNKALLSRTEPEEGEVQQVEHIEGVQEVEEAIIKEVSEVSVESGFVEKEHIQVVQSYVVDHEDSREGEGYMEECGGESVEGTEREESDETVLESSVPVNDVVEPEVKIEEVIIVQQQYHHFALPQDKLSDQYEATNRTSDCCVPAAVDSEHVDVVHKEIVPDVEKVTESLNGIESTFDITTKEVTVIAQEIVHVVLSENREMPEEAQIQPILADAEKVTEVHQELFVEKTVVEKDQLESGKTEFGDDQCAHLNPVQEEVLDLHEEVIANIPEVEASEALTVSVPITAAAVEEQVVAETVTLMDIAGETQEPVDLTVAEHLADVCPDAPAMELESEEHIIESASQTAAAIMNAAFEAAKGSIDGILDALPQVDAEAMPQHVEKEDVSQELSEIEIEDKQEEYIASVTESEVFTAGQDITQSVVKEEERFEEETVDHFTSVVDTGADSERHVEENDLQSDAKPAEECTKLTVDEKLEEIGHFNVVEIIGTEVHELEVAGDQTGVEIEVSKEISHDCAVQEVTEQVEADLEKQESVPQSLEPESLRTLPSAEKLSDLSTIPVTLHSEEVEADLEKQESVPQSLEPESLQILPSAEKLSDLSTIIVTLHSEEVDMSTEPQRSDSLNEATENTADQEVERVEEAELHETEVLCSLLTPEQSPQELDLLPTDIEDGDVGCTVSIESHSSTIVEKIIQTAVERVEEEVSHEPAPEGLHAAESNQRPEDISVIEVAAKEEILQHHETMQASESSRTVFIESHSSTTIVETIVLTTVTEVEKMAETAHEPTSEVLGEVETNGGPESSHISEVQEISEPPAMEPSPAQTTLQEEVSHTASIDTHSSSTVEEVVLTHVGGVENIAEELVLDAVPENVSEVDSLQEIEGADKPTTVAVPSDVLLPLTTDLSPEDTSAVRVTAENEEQVPCQLEICHAATKLSVCDLPDKQDSDQPPIDAHKTEQQSLLEQTAIETVPEGEAPTKQEDVLSEAEVTIVCTPAVLEHPAAVLTGHECFDSIKEKASQPVVAHAKDDVPVMEPDDAKEDVALQGVDQPHAPVESESPESQDSVTATSATEALSNECHEAPRQLKETETEQTIEVQEEQVVHSVQEVVPSQTEDGLQSKAPEAAHRPEDTQQEHSHTSEES